MSIEKNFLKDFRQSEHTKFYETIRNRKIVSSDQAEAIAYALYDISESIEKIYSEIIPEIINNDKVSKELLEDLLWDLKFEFQHIQYHMNDAELVPYGI